MTKKHFIAIAALLDANRASLAIVSDFADLFEEENPRFNRQQFVEAATLNMRDDLNHALRALDYETKTK